MLLDMFLYRMVWLLCNNGMDKYIIMSFRHEVLALSELDLKFCFVNFDDTKAGMAPRIDEPVQLAQFASSSKRSTVCVSRDTPNQDTLTVAVQDVGIHSVVRCI